MALNFQQRSSAFIGRVLVAVLLVVSIALMVLYSCEGNGGPLHTAQNAVVTAVSPLKFVGAAVNSATETAGNNVENITADETTLSGLREYNAKLIEQYTQMEEYKQENERLRKLVDLKDSYDIEGVAARVVGRSSQAWDQTVTIDKGSNDGIDAGLTVMGTSGVVGQVVSVSKSSATVRLLTDPHSGAAARVQSSREEGIVRGSLEGLLYLEDLAVNAKVAEGDVVLTSGLGGSYVKGLVIGTVISVESQQDGVSLRAVVAPNDKVSSLEEVLVVSSADAQEDTSNDN